MKRIRELLALFAAITNVLPLDVLRGLLEAIPAFLAVCKPLPVAGQVREYLGKLVVLPPLADVIAPLWEAWLARPQTYADDPEFVAMLSKPTSELRADVASMADEMLVGIDPATIALIIQLIMQLIELWKKRKPEPTPEPGPAPNPAPPAI
jgi:hypothetical protein